MPKFRRLEHILQKSVFVLIALTLGVQIFVQRGLFADGAYFLVYMLDKKNFFVDEPTRLFCRWIMQTPTLAAVYLGVTNLAFLRYLFSATLLSFPVLLWVSALWNTRDDFLFWPLLGLFAFVYFDTAFFSLGEYNFAYALSAFMLAQMLRQRPLAHSEKIILIIAAIMSIMSYASTFFFGPLLAVVALCHGAKVSERNSRNFWFALAIVFFISAAVGLWGYLYPGIPGNKKEAGNLLILIYDRQIWMTGFVLVLTGLQLFAKSEGLQIALFSMALILDLLVLTGLFQATPFMNYAARAYVGVAFAGVGVVLSLVRFYGHRVLTQERLVLFKQSPYVFVPLFVLFAALCFWDLLGSMSFGRYVDDFQRVVNGRTGFIPHGVVEVWAADDDVYGWSWTSPSMSLILRDSSEGAIVLNPDYGVASQLFDPLKYLPDFTRYYRR